MFPFEIIITHIAALKARNVKPSVGIMAPNGCSELFIVVIYILHATHSVDLCIE